MKMLTLAKFLSVIAMLCFCFNIVSEFFFALAYGTSLSLFFIVNFMCFALSVFLYKFNELLNEEVERYGKEKVCVLRKAS